jgi:hypothetical protein
LKLERMGIREDVYEKVVKMKKKIIAKKFGAPGWGSYIYHVEIKNKGYERI